MAQQPGVIGEDRLSSRELLPEQDSEVERRREVDSLPGANWNSIDCCTCVYIVYTLLIPKYTVYTLA